MTAGTQGQVTGQRTIAGERGVRPERRPSRRAAFSLLELLLVVTLIGILGAVAWSRYAATSTRGLGRGACGCRCAEIDTQVGLWRRATGSWPATDLSDIGANATYFPRGLPTCPIDGGAYHLDATTHRVVPHAH